MLLSDVCLSLWCDLCDGFRWGVLHLALSPELLPLPPTVCAGLAYKKAEQILHVAHSNLWSGFKVGALAVFSSAARWLLLGLFFSSASCFCLLRLFIVLFAEMLFSMSLYKTEKSSSVCVGRSKMLELAFTREGNLASLHEGRLVRIWWKFDTRFWLKKVRFCWCSRSGMKYSQSGMKSSLKWNEIFPTLEWNLPYCSVHCAAGGCCCCWAGSAASKSVLRLTVSALTCSANFLLSNEAPPEAYTLYSSA